MKWDLQVKEASIDTAGITKDNLDALFEYIWNGFEADADSVAVELEVADTGCVSLFIIRDDGSGIPYETLAETFGAFLASPKNNKSIRIKSQTNKGKGRFSFLAFGSAAEWTTIYRHKNNCFQYSLILDASERDKFVTPYEPQPVETDKTGTIVKLNVVEKIYDSEVSYKAIRDRLLEEFAWYLYLNRANNKHLIYNGIIIDYKDYINTELSKTISKAIDNIDFQIDLTIWKNKVANMSKIYYFNEHGILIHAENTSFNKNAVDFYHAVFIKSSFFNDTNFLITNSYDGIDLDPSTGKAFRSLKLEIYKLISDALTLFLTARADEMITDMQRRNNYPFFQSDTYGKLKKKNFDNVVKSVYCFEPRIFYRLKDIQAKSLLAFLNLLLDSDERENILNIMDSIVTLSKEQRDDFAKLLQRNKLENIIDTIKFVQDRYKVIETLKALVFDLNHYANERLHIQQVIEQNYWIFGEQYRLVTADADMTKALKTYEASLIAEGHSIIPENTVMSLDERRRRMDVFLYGSRITDSEKEENLIVELKAPSISVNTKVLNQIMEYANIIRKEPRFLISARTWKFFAIGCEIDDNVSALYDGYAIHNKKWLVGLIDNFEIYAISWADLFETFRIRHNFLLQKLEESQTQIATEIEQSITMPSRETANNLTTAVLDGDISSQ